VAFIVKKLDIIYENDIIKTLGTDGELLASHGRKLYIFFLSNQFYLIYIKTNLIKLNKVRKNFH